MKHLRSRKIIPLARLEVHQMTDVTGLSYSYTLGASFFSPQFAAKLVAAGLVGE